MERSFIVAGVARNCGQTIESELETIRSALQPLGKTKFLIIESDSSDNTVEVLERLESTLENFRFFSLGRLADRFSKRTERIAYCRNIYLEEIKENSEYHQATYVLIADLDGIVRELGTSAVVSCFEKEIVWSACCANQKHAYYDIWALRHPTWSPNDCWVQFNFLKKYLPERDARFVSVWSRMININEKEDWIEVDSAFGGLALYKKDIFVKGKYVGLDEEGKEVCEHVTFNEIIRKNGGKIFINPGLIINSKSGHTRQNIFKRLILRFIRLF